MSSSHTPSPYHQMSHSVHSYPASSPLSPAGVGSVAPIVLVESRAAVVFKTVLSGVGFMCDAYDLFVMNVLLVVLGCDFAQPDEPSNTKHVACFLPADNKSALATAVLVGSIAGQLLFGVLADYLGRRRSFIATLSLLIVGAASSAASHSLGAMSVFVCLSLCRFVLGIGVGGEYPLSATVSSEASVATAGRGKRVSLVFSMQGVGLLAAPAVVLALLSVVPVGDFSLVWRIALGLGGLPALCMLYFRFQMKETAAFTAQSSHARDTSEKWEELKEHWKDLLATAGSWFIFDVVFYANSLFSSAIVAKFITQPDISATAQDKHNYVVDVALSTLYLALCALPGYFAATLVIDRWGRRNLQLFGFFGMLLSYLVCGLTVPYLTDNRTLFYFVYGLSFFFCNMGPNVTTFVIPSELFPTAIRASAHGLSAASGKLGAALGTAMMPVLLAKSSLSAVLYVSAAISAVGLIFTAALTVESSNINLLLGQAEDEGQPQVEVREGLEDDLIDSNNKSAADWKDGSVNGEDEYDEDGMR